MSLAVFSPEVPDCFQCCALMPNQIVGMKVYISAVPRVMALIIAKGIN